MSHLLLNFPIVDKKNIISFKSDVVDAVEIFTVAEIKTWGWITNKYPKLNLSYLYLCLNSILYLNSNI